MASLGDIDRRRLAQLLGMLGSVHDGEVVNAGRAAVRLLAKAGMTFPEVLVPQASPRADLEAMYAAGFRDGHAAGLREHRRVPIDWTDAWASLAGHLLIDHDELLSDWDARFCESWRTRHGVEPTPRQLAVLKRLALKCDCLQ